MEPSLISAGQIDSGPRRNSTIEALSLSILAFQRNAANCGLRLVFYLGFTLGAPAPEGLEEPPLAFDPLLEVRVVGCFMGALGSELEGPRIERVLDVA